MKTFRFFILQLALLCITSSIFSQKNERELKFEQFPLYEEVYTFLSREIKFRCTEYEYSIAKKLDGYYLVLSKYEEAKISDMKYVKIWDAGTSKFITPKIDENIEKYEGETENALSQLIYNEIHFDFMYVYGYPEWVNDLESLLSNKENITSKEYEMLARATSEQASDYIHPNQYGSYLSETKNLKDPVYEKIEPYRVEQFIQRSQKSLNYYNQIKQQTPNYHPLIITDIDLKIAHDLMHCYSNLMSVKEPEAAKVFLDQVNYNEGYLTYAKDILEACPLNSILITHGDSDTYPLWFLQEKHGYRKDVLVLNLSLMQTAWYLTMTKEMLNYSSELMKTDFINLYREFFIMEEMEENDEVLPFKEWMDLAKKRFQEAEEKRLTASEYEKNSIYIYLPNSCMLSVNGEEIPANITNYYVSMVDIVLLDLIHSNPKRTICTTSPTAFTNMNLINNCAVHGPVFELTSEETERYEDNTSVDIALKYIKKVDPQMFKLMGDVGMYKLSMIYNDLTTMIESESVQKTLFIELSKKFPNSFLIANYTPEFLTSITEAAADIDPTLCTKFKEEYASSALTFIDKVNINAPTIKKDVKDLQYIFQIYAEANWQLLDFKKSNFSKTEKQVLQAIKDKLNQLSESKRIEDLIWTKDQIDTLKIAFEEIKL